MKISSLEGIYLQTLKVKSMISAGLIELVRYVYIFVRFEICQMWQQDVDFFCLINAWFQVLELWFSPIECQNINFKPKLFKHAFC